MPDRTLTDAARALGAKGGQVRSAAQRRALELGRKLGSAAAAEAAHTNPEQRKQIARRAALARWAKRRQTPERGES